MMSAATIRRASETEHGSLVLLHPIGLSNQFWLEFLQHIPKNIRCHSVDLRGHGHRSWDGNAFTIHDLAKDVSDQVQNSGPSIVVGCSMGGMVAQEFALLSPDKVSGLIICNSTDCVPTAAAPLFEARARAILDAPQLAASEMVERWFAPSFKKHEPDKVAHILELLMQADPRVIACGWNAISSFDVSNRVKKIDCPTLVVTGTQDSSTPLQAAAEHASRFRNGRLHSFDGAGHLLPYEQPKVLADLVLSFLASVQGREKLH